MCVHVLTVMLLLHHPTSPGAEDGACLVPSYVLDTVRG